ncbi:MAPEG family protein [Parvularcula maris]|uniref:MAPEG family protein n=1 Tax=Parvularcula maris TaxID=2965077 RepID=A0A9X2L7Q8_9PROT|nr:MAPEG family protein [Parvularcula maris]MCQ8184572.1 MAPEG family protein [Parvularcula maris]
MTAVLPPLFIMVALAIVTVFLLAAFRIIPSLSDKALAKEAAKGRKDVFSPRSKLFADNLQNQFETPVLFYAAVLLAIITEPVSDWFITLAWVYAIARVLHTIVHVTVNIVIVRLALFTVSVVVLILMWVSLHNNLMG